ncbi:MAG: hydroxylamine reductase [Bacteroidales bacterium]|nr:hydroxylamine reductase [Bacteroidales bacterium]
MFCYQCQETAKGTGCTVRGVCGKEPYLADQMDNLIYAIRGLCVLHTHIKKSGKDCDCNTHLIFDGLFATITNANFCMVSTGEKLKAVVKEKKRLLQFCKDNGINIPNCDEVYCVDFDHEDRKFSVMFEPDEEIRGLKQLLTYGAKGTAAYIEHAANLGFTDKELNDELIAAIALTCCHNEDVGVLMRVIQTMGEIAFKAMELLDKANTKTYGQPEITKVDLGVGKNPGILVSGHDLKDLEELLEQTQNTGVDVYTHSEMLPAHYYPFFKKYPNFKGNYGNAWWKQRIEFETFNGPVLFTSNCIVPPLENASYKGRIFTTNSTAYPNTLHIADRVDGKPKDFSPIINKAKECEPPIPIEKGQFTGGFAHNQVIALADKIVEAVKSGAIRKFVVMAGCDGRMPERDYYTEFAKGLPKDTVILTAGCAKYRYIKLNLGEINGIPRVLDAGQCNDCYSLVKIALALKDAFNVKDVNELPIVYNIAWYEQKAVAVLLALLSLGIQNLHIGPSIPTFMTPDMRYVLKRKFNIGTITTVENDLETMLM